MKTFRGKKVIGWKILEERAAYDLATKLKKDRCDVYVLSEVARSCPLPLNEIATQCYMNLDKVTRIEIIEDAKRKYVKWNCKPTFSLQDRDRTLKIFINSE